MIRQAFVLMAAAGLSALAAPAMADVQFRVEVGVPPPAVVHAPPARVVEYLPPAQPGYVWVPGRWVWDYGRYVWTGGYWMAAQPVLQSYPPRYAPAYGPGFDHHRRHEWREWREREHERRQDPRSYPPDTPRGSLTPRR